MNNDVNGKLQTPAKSEATASNLM